MADGRVVFGSGCLALSCALLAGAIALARCCVTEQVEEEGKAGLAVEQLQLAGDETSALLMLDHRLGQRSKG